MVRMSWRSVSLLIAVGVSAAGCSRKGDGRAPAAVSGAPSAAPSVTQLERSLADWGRRWQREPTPPSCDALLTQVPDQHLCVEAAAALDRLKRAVSQKKPAAELIGLAGDLAVAGSAAEQRIQRVATAALSQPSAAPSHDPAEAGEGTPETEALLVAERRSHPYARLLRGYGRLARQGLRYIGVYLELDAAPTREVALKALERAAPARHPWATLAEVAHHAAPLETDSSRKQRLATLETSATPPSVQRPNGPGRAPREGEEVD